MTKELADNLKDSDIVILEDLGEGVQRITLNRASQRNAMNRAARLGLVAALDNCRDNGKTKVVIITGSGSAFCSGVDLKEARQNPAGWSPPDTLENRRSLWHGVQDEIRLHPAIVIAAVNGVALGGGVTLVNTCDLAIASETAEFGMPEVSFGAFPGLAGPSTMLRTSMKRAAFMVLTGNRISAQEAQEWGLINLVVSADELQSEAILLARRIATFNAHTLEFSKRALWNVPTHIADYSAALQYGITLNAEIQRKMKSSESSSLGVEEKS